MKIDNVVKTKEKEEYIKTKSGVWLIKYASDVNKYFECKIDGMTMSVFEGSNFWKQSEIAISDDLISLCDALVMVQPKHTPKVMNIELLMYFISTTLFISLF